MKFEEKINKLLDLADEAKKAGDYSKAAEKYLKAAEFYFDEAEAAIDAQEADKLLRYGKAFVRAAQILEKNKL